MLDKLNSLKTQKIEARLQYISENFPNQAVFSSSFSIEDQLITYFIAKHKLKIAIFTLDTSRLFNETYEVWHETINKYDISIKSYHPDVKKLIKYTEENGVNAFYKTKELRLECCNIRKVEPLKQALKDYDIWLSGIRISQSNSRQDKALAEYDRNFAITKFYPILELEDDKIWQIIRKNNIPYNKLYDKGFTSIGCNPCSRIPSDLNDPRSGRWWWEENSQKECGLHIVNGKLIREKNAENKYK